MMRTRTGKNVSHSTSGAFKTLFDFLFASAVFLPGENLPLLFVRKRISARHDESYLCVGKKSHKLEDLEEINP